MTRPLNVNGLLSLERFLIGWLALEEWSALGECEGAALSHLALLGLVEYGHAPPYTGRTGVRLTAKGFEANAELKRLAATEANP